MRWVNKLGSVLGVYQKNSQPGYGQIDQIRKKLNRLIELDQEKKIFGADIHQYQINTALSEQQLTDYEARYGIQIPADYRLYLQTIGDGGAGPFYGLLPLVENGEFTPDLSEDFPYTRENPLRLQMILDEDHQDQEWDHLLDQHYTDAEKGIKILAHEGCGMYSILIMRGAEYGNVWYLDLANDVGAYPLTSPVTQGAMHFFEWIDLWLESALAELETGNGSFNSYADFII